MSKKPDKHPDRRTPLSDMDRLVNVGGRARQTLVTSYQSRSAIERPVLTDPYQSRTYFSGITRLLCSGAAADRLIYTSPKNPALGFVAVWREIQPDGCTSHYALRHPVSKGVLRATCAGNDYPRTNYLLTANDEYNKELIADLSAAIDFTCQGLRRVRYIDEAADLSCTRALNPGNSAVIATAYESNREGLAVVATTHLRDDTTTFLAFPANTMADAEAMLSTARMDMPAHNIKGGLDVSLWRTEESAETTISLMLAQVALAADTSF